MDSSIKLAKLCTYSISINLTNFLLNQFKNDDVRRNEDSTAINVTIAWVSVYIELEIKYVPSQTCDLGTQDPLCRHHCVYKALQHYTEGIYAFVCISSRFITYIHTLCTYTCSCSRYTHLNVILGGYVLCCAQIHCFYSKEKNIKHLIFGNKKNVW